MSTQLERDLIDLFRAFLSHHPSMRFGQALCGVSNWEDEDPNLVSDDTLLSSIKAHLEANFEDDAYSTEHSSMDDALVGVLREIRHLEPSVPLGRLLCRIAAKVKANPYDIENDELAVAIRNDLAKLQGSATK